MVGGNADRRRRANVSPTGPRPNPPLSFLDAGRPLRVLILQPDGRRARAHASTLDGCRDIKTALYANLRDIPEWALEDADVLLVWREAKRRLHAPTFAPLSRLVRLVLAIEQTRFFASARDFEIFDTPIFVDMPVARQIAGLRMAALGYLVLPDALDRTFALNRFRLETACTLSSRDLEVLLALRRGDSNARIGRALGISEALVKSRVRRVLWHVSLRNRTEAALFAIACAGELRAVLRDRRTARRRTTD